jgi:hypothetical protein
MSIKKLTLPDLDDIVQTDFDLSTFVIDTTKGDKLLDLLMNGLKLIKDHIDHKIYNNCKKRAIFKFERGSRKLYDQYLSERDSLCFYLQRKLGINNIGFKKYHYCQCIIVVIEFYHQMNNIGFYFTPPKKVCKIKQKNGLGLATAMYYLNILPINKTSLFDDEDD